MSKKQSPEMLNLNLPDANGWAIIHYFAAGGNTIAIVIYAQAEIDLNQLIKSDEASMALSPLVLAIRAGYVEAACALIARGADVELVVAGMSPILYAIQHKEKALELVKALVQNGANIDLLKGAVEKHGADILKTMLSVSEEAVEGLFKLFTDKETVMEDYILPFEADEFGLLEVTKEIDLDIQRDFAACDIDKVIAYIQHPDVSEKDKYTANLFVAAGMQHNIEYTKLMIALIQSGYDINHVNHDGMTSIQHVAGLSGSNGIMLGLLLESGANVNELGKDGLNAVHNAC